VIRLVHTQADAGEDVTKKVGDMYHLLNDRNGADYRVALTNAVTNPPSIPYIGLMLRDMIYFDTGLKSEDAKGVNLKKVASSWGIWEIIERLQKVKYSFTMEPNEKLENELATQLCITGKELLDISRLREPKNSKREAIQ